MVPLCAARVSPRLHRTRRAATAIDCIAPFPRLSVSLHTGQIGVPGAGQARVPKRRGAERR